MKDIKAKNIAVVGDNTRISGGQHFHEHHHYADAPTGGPPLQRPPRVEQFTNRKAELARLLNDLKPGNVVTLWGPGGMGKSALAAVAVWTLAPGDNPPEDFPDGIIFHSFYNQPNTDLALEAIARAYGVEPKPTARDAALQALGGKCALLLLDGTEAVTESKGRLEDVLDIRGRCGVIVTTRLSKDAVAELQELTPLEEDEAVKLLQAWGKDRANDSAAAHRICILVGRLPLAVRLVGRYLKETGETAAEYLSWLEDTPLDALDQGDRRLKSVPILLERSLFQVSEPARQLLAIAGILALAPFDRKVVAAALDQPENKLRRPLNELVNYGLLLRREQWYEVSHALIHTYAREKIILPPETVANLAAYYTEFAKEHCKQGPQGYLCLDGHREHVMRILSGCMERSQWQAARSLAWAVREYLDVQGHLTELILVNQTGVELARKLEDRHEEGAWLNNLGLAYRALGKMEKAVEHHQKALEIHREIGYCQGEAVALISLGLVYSTLGEVEKAVEHHQKALEIHVGIGYRRGEADALTSLGLAYSTLGEAEKAIEHHQKGLEIHREIGYRRGEADALRNLGNTYSTLGEAEKAVEHHQKALEIHREIGYRRGEANALTSLGLAYSTLGDVKKAVEHHQKALEIHREIGYRRGEADALTSLGLAYSTLGEAEKAVEHHQKGLEILREIGYRQVEAIALTGLGLAYSTLGEVEKAVEHLSQALVILEEIKSPYANLARQKLDELTSKN